MKIISKRQAMAIYRLHPESRLFRFCTGKYSWSGSSGYQRCSGCLCRTTPGPERTLCLSTQRHSKLTL